MKTSQVLIITFIVIVVSAVVGFSAVGIWVKISGNTYVSNNVASKIDQSQTSESEEGGADNNPKLEEQKPIETSNITNASPNINQNKDTTELNPKSNIIKTAGYFPIDFQLSLMVTETNDDNSYQRFFTRYIFGKKNVNGKEVYVVSTTPIVNSNEIEQHRNYSFYSVDQNGDVNKIGDGTLENPKWKDKTNWDTLLLGEMEVDKEYITRQNELSKTTLKCLGIKDVKLPNGELYKDCLCILKTMSVYESVFKSTYYYSKDWGLVKFELESDNGKGKVSRVIEYINSPL